MKYLKGIYLYQYINTITSIWAVVFSVIIFLENQSYWIYGTISLSV